MDFKVKTKTYFEVNSHELSNFISEYYGRPYSMGAYEELRQDSYWIERVVKDTPEESGVDGWSSAEEAREEIDAWLAVELGDTPSWNFVRDHCISVSLLLWDLCQKDVIPAGEYLILVWW